METSHSTTDPGAVPGGVRGSSGMAGDQASYTSARPRVQPIEDMDDETLSTLVESLMVDTESSKGTYLALETTEDQEEQARELQKQYLMMSLRRGVFSNEPIAVDVQGRLDIDYGNPGPEINMQQQMTSTGLLSAVNEQEIQATAKQERYRGLSMFPRSALVFGPLEAEMRALEEDDDIHSVSVISMNQSEIEEWQPCPFDCWLKDASATSDLPPLPSLEPARALQAPSEDKGKSAMYEAIDITQTRLLHVQPGRYGDPIVCRLSVMEIAQEDAEAEPPSPYAALSYTWGDPRPKFSIECNSHALPVTNNLFLALQHLRLEKETIHVWVDAVCINQQDFRERNQQVLHMLQIYQNASHVIVWLGEEDEDSHLAFESMKYFDQRDQREVVKLRRHEPVCYDVLRKMYEAQVHLFERSWFRRSWIRQEISVARDVTVVCGRDTIRWYPMKRAAARLPRLYRKLINEGVTGISEFSEDQAAVVSCLTRGWIYGQSVVKLIGNIRSIWYYHTGGFLDLLMAGREYNATDPRDKVYSVLGLARVPTTTTGDGHPTETSLPVDYSKSVSEVYQDVVKYFINRDGNLDILAILPSHRNAISDAELPSWVPDWRVPASEIPVRTHWDFISTKLAAGGFRIKATPQLLSENGILRVEGWVIDTISKIDDYSARIHNLLETLPEYNLDSEIEDEDCDSSDDGTEKDLARQAKSRGERALYAEPFDPELHKVRCCITASGRLCLAPVGTKVGDDVALVLGSKLPFIFRQDTENSLEPLYPDIPSSAKFRLIGPCAVPDIMFGRLVKEFKDAGLKPVQFILV